MGDRKLRTRHSHVSATTLSAWTKSDDMYYQRHRKFLILDGLKIDIKELKANIWREKPLVSINEANRNCEETEKYTLMGPRLHVAL